MLENYMINDIHLSKYAASFAVVARNDGGLLYNEDCFKAWLKQLGFTDDQIYDCWVIGVCGKFELERDAKKFFEEHKKEYAGWYINK